MTTLDPTYVLAGVVALLIMVRAGVDKRRLAWRVSRCPVCHHPVKECTCRWL